MFRIGFLVVFAVTTVSAQRCADGTTGQPSVNGVCATGLTLSSGVCCCVDKINPNTGRSDCPNLTAYCSNSVYASLMLDQCAKTCGKCPGCADQINPNTGRSDCPQMTAYCTNSVYRDTMKTQCPKSCGFC